MEQFINYQEIMPAATDLGNKKDLLNTLLNTDLAAEIAKIGDGGVWEGESADMVREAFNKMKELFPELISTIQSCKDYLDKSYNDYLEIEKAIEGNV